MIVIRGTAGALALWAVACGGSGGGVPDGGDAPDARVVPDDVVGRIVVTGSRVSASFTAATEPTGVVADGGCRTYPYVCPNIGTGCDLDGPGYSVGPIHIEGAGDDFIVEIPAGLDQYHYADPGYHGFAPDATIVATAAGDELAGFRLESSAVDPFPDTSVVELPALTGQPVTITWTPGTTPGAAVVLEGFYGSPHGGIEGSLFECTSADTGSLAISATISAELASRAGFFGGSAELRRYREATLIEPGRDLRLQVATARAVLFGP